MADLCGVCNSQPKKYKCPTCQLPYCSLPCFKAHKPTHEITATTPAPPTPSIPTPTPAEAPSCSTNHPRNPTSTSNFSTLPNGPKYQALLTKHPSLIPTLRKIYAATLEPDPEDMSSPYNRQNNNSRGRGRGRGGRGNRGRGRGRGGGGGGGGGLTWTPKAGEKDAMRLIKRMREGRGGEGEMEALEGFVRLCGEVFGVGVLGEGDEEEEEEGMGLEIG